MYSLETSFANFRFNQNNQMRPFNMKWYILEEGDDADETGRCFTYSELEIFQRWVVNHSVNFLGAKNYKTNCNEDELPYCGGLLGLVPGPNRTFPSNFVLRKEPSLSRNILHCMDVILLNSGLNDNHDYDLDFNVIGVIQL